MVVCHDERLHRLTGQDLLVRKTSLARLRELDVGGHLRFGAFASIPTLEEVFAAIPPHFVVNVELKCDRVDDDGLSRLAGEYLSRPALADRVIVSSFNPLCLLRLAARYPRLRRGWLVDPDRPFWFENLFTWPCATFSVHPHHAAVTEPRMRRWKKAGYQVATWTVDDPREAERVRSLGVAYSITNRPRAVRKALKL
jgi:glycerophosphoryl diester phosphodiesterase